jgi:hypothetical protein
MRMVTTIVMVASCFSVSAQGTFQNLDFEGATIVPISGQPYAISVANALPDWTVDYNNVQQSQIFYNDPSLGDVRVTLLANGYPGSPGPIIDGNFSVLLQGGLFEGMTATASINQTGQIPVGSQSLFFDVGNGLLPNVFIGNDELTLFPIKTGTGVSTGYTTYGANISAWAGQTEQLTFSSPGFNVLLDDVSFSPSAIPEPDALVLTAIGGIVFAIYRHFFGKQNESACI